MNFNLYITKCHTLYYLLKVINHLLSTSRLYWTTEKLYMLDLNAVP